MVLIAIASERYKRNINSGAYNYCKEYWTVMASADKKAFLTCTRKGDCLFISTYQGYLSLSGRFDPLEQKGSKDLYMFKYQYMPTVSVSSE